MQSITFLVSKQPFTPAVFINATHSRLQLRITNNLPSKNASQGASELVKYYA